MQVYCRPCSNAKAAEYRARNPGAAKDARAKFLAANPNAQSQANAKFYAKNREGQKGRARAYREQNPEQHKAATMAWRAANRDRHVAMQKAWREANLDREGQRRRANYVRDRDRELAKAREWKAANPEKQAALNAKRMTAKLQAIPRWANLRKIEQIYADARTVSMCEREIHHVDHIVPLQGKTVCGLHCEANLQIIPGSANQSKGNRHWPGQPMSEAIRP